jgi:hypothetical protein
MLEIIKILIENNICLLQAQMHRPIVGPVTQVHIVIVEKLYFIDIF